jgi:DNA-directed RNA polymerase subunit N (RpoN/RPB10)
VVDGGIGVVCVCGNVVGGSYNEYKTIFYNIYDTINYKHYI